MLDTLKKHWRVVTKSHIYTRVYNWEQFKKRYPFGLPDRSEDQFVVGWLLFSNLLMAIYVPYWWIPVTAVTLFISYFMVISAIKWFPRDRNKLILREWRVKFKNGDERTIQFWIPRYAAQYTGDHYLFETYDALKKNSKAKYFRFVSPNDPFYYS